MCCSLRRRQVGLDVVVVTLNERNDGGLTRPPRRLVSLLKTRFERIDGGARQGTDTRQQQTRSPSSAQFRSCPFQKFHPVGIRAVRQNHRIIPVDALEGAKLSHGETVSGKAKGRPLQEGRHPRCRPRARAHPPSIRPSPPGTVQGLLRRAHILSAPHQRNHGTVQTQTSTTPHD